MIRWRRRRETCAPRSSEGGRRCVAHFCCIVAIAAMGFAAALGGLGAQADVAPTEPATFAVLNLDYVDTSGEPTDQTAAHQRRAAEFVSALQRDLAASGRYRIVPMSCGSAPCEPTMNPFELQKAARAAGAEIRPARRRAQNELPHSVGEDPNRRRRAGPGRFRPAGHISRRHGRGLAKGGILYRARYSPVCADARRSDRRSDNEGPPNPALVDPWIARAPALRRPGRFARLEAMDASSDSPEFRDRRARLTPMMAQYLEIKAVNPGCLLFYRMGDFYELFFEDAEIASRALGIVLTKRGKHEGEDIRMCGVPVERADDYLNRLIALGHRVAVCEQMEDPAAAKKRGPKSVVKRDVVRLVTPGTITEERLLEPGRARLLTAVQKVRSERGTAGLRARRARSVDRRGRAQRDGRSGPCGGTCAPGAERGRGVAGRVRRAAVFPDRPRDARSRDAARARRRRRRGGRTPGLRILRRRDPRRLWRVHPRGDRRRRSGAGLRQAHPVRSPAGALASDPARARDEPRDRSGDPRQSGAHAHAERRARRLAPGDDRPDRNPRQGLACLPSGWRVH